MQNERRPKLYSYIVTHDSGFAPNPFHGYCTLTCCKPMIRRCQGGAEVGDYIIGLRGKHEGYRVVYAMRATEKMTFQQYWEDQRFQVKKPDMLAGGTCAEGDNIYHWDFELHEYCQSWSRHSNKDGTENPGNKSNDTRGNRDCVLISNDFIYWGGESPDNPPFIGNIRVGRGYRCNFAQSLVEAFIEWFRRQPERGRIGMPTD